MAEVQSVELLLAVANIWPPDAARQDIVDWNGNILFPVADTELARTGPRPRRNFFSFFFFHFFRLPLRCF
jgi:hypothetical protein